jgi:putative transposase
MQRLNTAYGMYFRFKHTRPGHCFQGRHGARLVEGDEYLVRLTRYMHLNPVKTKAMAARPLSDRLAALREYRWSSHRGYAGHCPPEARVDYRWRFPMSWLFFP